jgi:3'(2'), 5'-bisphosphate nucleotidase
MLILEPVLQAARQAAALTTLVRQQGFESVDKAGEPVTIADYGSQALLCRALARAFPDDGVLAEEGAAQFMTLLTDAQRGQVAGLVGQVIGEEVSVEQVAAWLEHGRGVSSALTWIIDPIDGTKGYVAGRQYAIAIGALSEGEPISGVLACPGYGSGLLFYAQRGAAYVENLSGGRASRIAVSETSKTSAARVVASLEQHKGDHPGSDGLYAALGIRQQRITPVDSQAKYAMVACGDADLFMRLMNADAHRHYIWDHAPGVALVRAAGGVCTDMDGSPLRFDGGVTMPNRGMVISNGRLHDALIEAAAALKEA